MARFDDAHRADDDAALAFELRAARRVTVELRKAASAFTAWLLLFYARNAGPDGTLTPAQQQQLRAAADAGLAALAVDVAAHTTAAVTAATRLAIRQEKAILAAHRIDATTLDVVHTDPPLLHAGRDTARILDAAVVEVRHFATVAPLETASVVLALAANAAGAVPRVERQVRFVTNRAINQTTLEIAKATAEPETPAVEAGVPTGAGRVQLTPQGMRVVWWSERTACCVPGTRVSAPAQLSPSHSAVSVVPLDVADRLSADPAAGGMALRSNGRLPAAPTATESLGDLSGVLGVSHRDYVGKVVTIRTASGKEFTGTPNHPVATRGGWVGLAELQVGDYVFSRRDGHGRGSPLDPDLDDVQPRIEEVAEAFELVFPTRVMPPSPEDFHGDGAGTQVSVVWAHRLLRGGRDASLIEQFGKENLRCTTMSATGFDALGCINAGAQASLRSAIGLSQASDEVCPTPVIELMGSTKVTAQRQVITPKPPADSLHVDAIEYGDFLGRLAGLVEADEVVEVRNGNFSGHVYNLETVEGWYLSEDIVSHNCLTCLALSGQVADPNAGIGFDEFATFGKPGSAPQVWPPGTPLMAPPRHPACRCRLRIISANNTSIPEALQREAQRTVARGWSDYDSRRQRLAAADRLLAHSTLPKTVQARARADVQRGAFSTRHRPKAPELRNN